VNYLQRSFQISFALHILVVLLLIFMGDRFISSEKILVIDFALDDTAGAGNAENRAAVKTRIREHNSQQREIQKKDAEAAEPPAQTVPQAMPPVMITSRESPGVELQMPVSSRREATATSAIGEQDSTGKGITPAGSAPAAGSINASPGRGTDNFDTADRIKYMKENFAYIKDLINRQVTYPKTARQMGWQGKVKLSFFISSNGYAKGIKIVESSGVGILDKNAVEAVKSASPFPKPPVEAQLIIPIFYQLH
jgi:periplasmic protein TonB